MEAGVFAQVSQLKLSEHKVKNTTLDAGLTVPAQMPVDIRAQSDLILQVVDQTDADLIVLAVPATHRLSDRTRPVPMTLRPKYSSMK